MTPTIESLGIDRLSVDQRRALVDAIVDSIHRDEEGDELTDEFRAMIDARLAAHDANPDAAIPWEIVQAKALARIRQ